MSMADDQRAFARMCLAAKVDASDVARLRAPERRLMVYRNMVRGRLVEIVGDAMPRARDAAGKDRLAEMVHRFLATAPPLTRYIREVTPHFVAWLDAHRDALPKALPPWWLDLARYEAAVLSMHIAPDPAGDGVVDFDMALPVALAPAQKLLRVRWTVHEKDVRRVKGDVPQALLVHRHPERLTVETLALSPIAGDIYETWVAKPAQDATTSVQEVLGRHHASAGQVFIESFAELLGDLMDRGVVLGSRG